MQFSSFQYFFIEHSSLSILDHVDLTEGDEWCHFLFSSKNSANKDSNYLYSTRKTCEIILIKFHFIIQSKLWLYLVAGLHWSHFTEKQLCCWIAHKVINHEVSESTEGRPTKNAHSVFADEVRWMFEFISVKITFQSCVIILNITFIARARQQEVRVRKMKT